MEIKEIAKHIAEEMSKRGFNPKTPHNAQIAEALAIQCKAYGVEMKNLVFGPNGQVNCTIMVPPPQSILVSIDLANDETCKHDLKPYHGFTESYLYCTKCPHKEYPQ